MKKNDATPLDDFSALVDVIGDTALALRPNAKSILDAGCGGCHLAQNLMGKFPNADFTLLDIQDHMLKNAIKRTAGMTSGNVSFMQADMREVKIPAKSYDIITCMTALHLLDNPEDFEKVLRNFKRWLTRNGLLVIGNFVNEDNSIIADMQLERWVKHVQETLGKKRSEHLRTIRAQLLGNVNSLAMQIECLKTIGFKKVDILYKRYCFGAYYALKK